jgi:hypothetical protein
MFSATVKTLPCELIFQMDAPSEMYKKLFGPEVMASKLPSSLPGVRAILGSIAVLTKLLFRPSGTTRSSISRPGDHGI